MEKYKYFKRLLVICLMFLGISCDGIEVNAVSIRSGDFSYYELTDETISITKYHGTNEILTVPSEIDGKKVSKIGERAFEKCNKLKTISIPNSVKVIDEYAFYYCKNLESVALSEGIEKISESSFRDCSGLKTINIPHSVKTIEDLAFWYCTSLESIIIPNTVISIGTSAFIGCCESFIIYADSESPLREEAKANGFIFNCINHPQIITDNTPVSPTCTQDGKTAGSHCSVCDYVVPSKTIKATGHTWDEGKVTSEPTIQKSGTKTFTCKTCKVTKTETIPKLPAPTTGSTVTQLDDSYKVINSGKTVEYSQPKKSKTTITIPDTVTIDGITYKVTSISKNAFKNNKKLKKVIIGKNITKIEANAFSGCKNLKTITVKSTKLKSVGKNVFKGIHKKAKIKVPKKKLAAYKKLFSGKGQKSTVKITK